LKIGTPHGTRDEGHLLKLLEEHLRHFRLPAPVLKLRLATAAIQPFIATNQTLFARRGLLTLPSIRPAQNSPQHSFTKGARKRDFYNETASDRDWQQIVEQLQARLGRKAVQSLKPLADHRPEHALNIVEPGSQVSHVPHYFRRCRPLWLLPIPQPLTSRQGRPWRRGPLSVTDEPERIESGWWDGRDIRRDYYRAKDTDGSRLWIFRDLRGDHTWYLHGLFG
jgi:protein ImuB